MKSILDGLNDEQREAVTSTEGFVRVIAGAGSGKTRALVSRFAYLVGELGVLPGSILCVTFTNKSAGEMQRRVSAMLGDAGTGYINTFHGFCLNVLREESHVIQYPKNFMVLDNADIDAMLGIIYEERGLTLRHMTFAQARDMIEIRKLFKEPDYYLGLTAMTADGLRARYEEAESPEDIIFCGYLYQEKKCFGVDYNDLIKLTLHIFAENETSRTKWQSRLEYIMIDEFQDIDMIQYELMKVLCGMHGNLFIVGDPDQTIYTWRGANVKYLLDFGKNFPNVKTIMMNRNYRSTPQIVAAANSLIDKNSARIKKSLSAVREDGATAECAYLPSASAEADWIAAEIKRLTEEHGASFGDITVMYRAHHVTRVIEDALMREGIPYSVHSGVPFFGRREVRDAIAYLRMVAFGDDLSFLRIVNVPKRNIGERRVGILKNIAERDGISLFQALKLAADTEDFRGSRARRFVGMIESFALDARPASDLLTDILDASGYERMLRTEGAQDRLDNLAELKQFAADYEMTCGEEPTLAGFLAHAAIYTGAAQDRADGVRLMTVHAAKGLEFPYVFLCGMNEGIFPSKKVRTIEAMEEERRLAFVAMTRAKDGLFISCAGGKNFDGAVRWPSRFLLEIDPQLLSCSHPMPGSVIGGAGDYIAVSSAMLRNEVTALFGVGTRVRHRAFGPGAVREIDESRSAYIIKFDGLPAPRAISFGAPMEAE